MKIVLLTHQRELKKHTNTGSLVVDVLGAMAEVIVWERTNPSAVLLKYIASGSAALLYPSDNSQYISSSDVFEHYIVIDGTWQEARKIYNRSPYLHSIPAVAVRFDRPSAYTLRRNQKPGCYCTAECVIEVLNVTGFDTQAQTLQAEFTRFLSQ